MVHIPVFAALLTPIAMAVLAQTMQIAIDVSPGNTPTVIESGRGGRLPVAILSTPAFDATTIDPSTIRFGPTGTEAEPVRTVSEDVDRDERVDLMTFFLVTDLSLPCGQVDLRVKAQTSSGAAVEGAERVTVSGCVER